MKNERAKELIDYFTSFQDDVGSIELPSEFTYPFYYEPHELSIFAAQEVQKYLAKHGTSFTQYGLGKKEKEGYGKMFGVLVVQDAKNQLGYLAAYSGEIFERGTHNIFVPPIYDKFDPNGYFLKECEFLNELNAHIERVEKSLPFVQLSTQIENLNKEKKEKLERQRILNLENKKQRKKERMNCSNDSESLILLEKHKQESLNDKFLIKEYNVYLTEKCKEVETELFLIQEEIENYKLQRKEKSVELQNWLFDQYNFLNARGDLKNVQDIFKEFDIEVPPSGAGDCAAPKLLHYAFRNNLKPVAMAEFWWGKSPSTKVRRQGYFYPACRGKCEPILHHMLKGLQVAPNPILQESGQDVHIEKIYEDEHLVVINKPTEFLSVPGKHKYDSVYARIHAAYPKATGPLIVHRLDMSTSGLMLLAKSKFVHQELQKQFIDRSIRKSYVALLDGRIEKDSGTIKLPLRVDLDNRPFQQVCYEHGKPAITEWEVIERTQNQTMVRFFPITGRTHQLRVHAAHHKGLNCPIVGDDLYGKKGGRLCLHAEKITFDHPVRDERVTFYTKELF